VIVQATRAFFASGRVEEPMYFRCFGGFAAKTTEKIVISLLPQSPPRKQAQAPGAGRQTHVMMKKQGVLRNTSLVLVTNDQNQR
jgi:hypothetical protein